MRSRHYFILLMAAVLVGRTLHCCYVQAGLCGSSILTGEAANGPLSNPNDNDPNESGCICKGAVLKAPAVFEAVRSQLESLNPLAGPAGPSRLAVTDPASQRRPIDRHLLGPPLLGGRALRAYLGSLLI